MFKTGNYSTLIQGVSQQIPQERTDGQLGEQVNMLSDIVSGLRRRTGFKYQGTLDVVPSSAFNITQLNGEYYVQAVTPEGTLNIYRVSTGELIHTSQHDYLKHTRKSSIRNAVCRGQCFIVNTEVNPTKEYLEIDDDTVVPPEPKNPLNYAWIKINTSKNISSIRGTITYGTQVKNFEYYAGGDPVTAANEYVAAIIHDNPDLVAVVDVTSLGSSIFFKAKSTATTVKVEAHSNSSTISVLSSNNNAPLTSLGQLPNAAPNSFDGYPYVVNGVTYTWDISTGTWSNAPAKYKIVNPKDAGWLRVQSGTFSKSYSVTVSREGASSFSFEVTTSDTVAAEATAEYIATELVTKMDADTDFTALYNIYREGTVVAIVAKESAGALSVWSGVGDTYMTTSDQSNVALKGTLPPLLPSVLDGYIMSVGSGNNLAYYAYNKSTQRWKEVGVYEDRYDYTNVAMFWYFDYDTGTVVVDALRVQGRVAGNEDNNPEPEFFSFGITGISAYQSRLILLSGSYVCMSRSADPTTFMRTTVTELLDDDPIEVSATSLSNAQFEYAIPYNKDLILFAQTQQAVIANNSTVLTPKSATIYPTTTTEISLACQPTVIARSLYYAYQRTTDYYQVGEFLPSPYTDSQYSTQSTTEHIPLYATGICTAMSGSTASNLACFSSDSPSVLINQFYWAGDERPLMAYHKWELPYSVVYNGQVEDTVVFLLAYNDQTLLVSTNTQLNQLGDKPVPFLDLYQYVTIGDDGYGDLPSTFFEDSVAVVYDDVGLRHYEVAYEIVEGRIQCEYIGTIALGVRYESSFQLTPPFLKDQDGGVVSSAKSTVHSIDFTFKNTGDFKYTTLDTYGYVADIKATASTWSEVNLSYTWINSISDVKIPCRTKLNSTQVELFCDSTTDLNVVSTAYNIRVPTRDVQRRR